MKITVLTVILLVLAVIIAVGSVTVLGPCVHEDGSEAPCAGTGRAILADGILLGGWWALSRRPTRPRASRASFSSGMEW